MFIFGPRSWIRTTAVTVLAVASLIVFAVPARAGVQDNVRGWAWSDTIGWISMNCTNETPACTTEYGVHIEVKPGFDDRADLTGWAWSDPMGWICFGMTCSGTTPDGQVPYAEYRSSYNGKDDQFFGWAQVLNLGAEGWISLNCENLNECATSNYHVVLNDLLGDFTKGAFNDYWAWNGNDDGTGVGWIDFSIVSTTWTLAKIGRLIRPQGIYEPDNPGLIGTHLHTFEIGFQGISAPEGFMLSCDVKRSDASIMRLSTTFPSTVRNGYASVQYTVVEGDPVDNNIPWVIQDCAISTMGSTTACTDDAPCLPDGICDFVSGFCREVVDSTDKKRPIFTHGNDWTGLGSDEDQYRALKCTAGFPGQFFRNAVYCDFTGDASFALAMRRGIPVEGDCSDGIDNDGNGQIDCADRYCRGLSYICRSHTPTMCVWGQTGDGVGDCTDAAYQQGNLCCTQQSVSETDSNLQHIVNGLECVDGDPDDGYFDCGCTDATAFSASSTDDCFAPGYRSGDLCCNSDDEVVRL